MFPSICQASNLHCYTDNTQVYLSVIPNKTIRLSNPQVCLKASVSAFSRLYLLFFLPIPQKQKIMENMNQYGNICVDWRKDITFSNVEPCFCCCKLAHVNYGRGLAMLSKYITQGVWFVVAHGWSTWRQSQPPWTPYSLRTRLTGQWMVLSIVGSITSCRTWINLGPPVCGLQFSIQLDCPPCPLLQAVTPTL